MKYLILGASAAGISCARTLRSLDETGEITVISQDKMVYSRCMLHHLLSGKRTIESLNFTDDNFFTDNSINWINGEKAASLDIRNKKVTLEGGKELNYDKLLIATGASSFFPPVKNLKEAGGVFGLRNYEDVLQIKENLEGVEHAAVLGAGLVGIDAMIGLIENNVKVTLIELADKILPLQMDKNASAEYENLFKKKGVQIYTSVKAESVSTDTKGRIKEIHLSDGTTVSCQMLIIAAGVRPNTDFITQETIAMDKGIQINECCQTSVPDVFAAGDVCANTPIWPMAVKQGITAAYNMAGQKKEMDDFFGLKNSVNFFGLQTVSLGLTDPPDSSYNVYIFHDKQNYKKIIEKDGLIYGAILQGDISYCGTMTHLIGKKIKIGGIKKDIFEIDYSDFFSMKENGEFAYLNN